MMAPWLMLAAVAAAPGVKDPFWPIGYEGERRVISASPRRVAPAEINAVPEISAPAKKAEAGAAAADEKAASPVAAEIAAEDWERARATLKLGSVVRFAAEEDAERSIVVINSRAYELGQTVSVIDHGIRFVWRISSGDGRSLKLERVRATRLDAQEKKKTAKGGSDA